jgi:3',5'-nucleoside bisphosphate phosphatase
MLVELHCHSTCSDGSEAPEQVAARARRRGVQLFALTDHDSVQGCAAAAAALAGSGAHVLRAVELSCTEAGRSVHLLIYDVAGDERWEALTSRLGELQRARRHRVRAMAARLEQRGIRIDVEPLLAAAGTRTVGRPDVARALVEAGAVGSTGEAFRRYLHDGGPADVPLGRLGVGDGLALARAAGARVSLAHPHTIGTLADELFRRHRDEGLEGIEAGYGPYSSAERRNWTRYADERDLVVTAGSDFHGAPLPHIAEPVVELDDRRARRLCEWLQRST